MKKITALLSSLLIITIPNILLAQDIKVTPEMIQKFEAGCNSNSGSGCWLVAYAYDTGQGVKQDYFKAVDYYTKACNLIMVLGVMTLVLSITVDMA